MPQAPILGPGKAGTKTHFSTRSRTNCPCDQLDSVSARKDVHDRLDAEDRSGICNAGPGRAAWAWRAAGNRPSLAVREGPERLRPEDEFKSLFIDVEA